MHRVCVIASLVYKCVWVATMSRSSIGCHGTLITLPKALNSVFYRSDLRSEQLEQHLTLLIHGVYPNLVTRVKMINILENRKQTSLGGMATQIDNIFAN